MSKLANEVQGNRKADAYVSVLRLLCEQFMNSLQEGKWALLTLSVKMFCALGLSRDCSASSIATVEVNLQRAASAVRIIYGQDFILEEDLSGEVSWKGKTISER